MPPTVGVTVGATGLTSTVTSFSEDTLPWLSVAFSLTVYLPTWFVLIVLFPVLPFTDTTSTCVPLPLVRPGLSSLSLALTSSVGLKGVPYSTTFLGPVNVGVSVGASFVTGVACQLYGLLYPPCLILATALILPSLIDSFISIVTVSENPSLVTLPVTTPRFGVIEVQGSEILSRLISICFS